MIPSRQTLPLILFASVLLFGGCSGSKTPASDASAKKGGIPVRTMVLEKTDFTEYGEYYGKLEARTRAVLTAPGGGRVESLDAEEGDIVLKGDSLGSVNAESAMAAFRAAELNERIAGETLHRQQELLRKGNASRFAVDQAELALLSARKELIDARRLLEGARAESPVDGVIVSRHIELFDVIPPGAPTFTVADTSRMRVGIGIPESEIAGIAKGNPAKVSFDIYPGEVWEGSLLSLDGEVSPESLTFAAEVVIDNSDGRLAPGLTARVELLRRNLPDMIVIPSQALLSDGSDSFVMLADGGRALRRQVVTGPSDTARTVIIDGIADRAELIVEGNHLVADGSAIARVGQEG
jgi:RND family efflux transporter MFP subunit